MHRCALLRIKDVHTNLGAVGRSPGCILIVAAIVLVVYSTWVYRIRNAMIAIKKDVMVRVITCSSSVST